MKATTRQVFREVEWPEFIDNMCGCRFERSLGGRLFTDCNPHRGTICTPGFGTHLFVLAKQLKAITCKVPRVWFLRARELPKCRLESVGL